MKTELKAKWIWKKQAEKNPYNQTVIARKGFSLTRAASRAEISVTADCWYRLMINGEWINDGPARSWPEHFEYDHIDVTPYLVEGDNEIVIIARYYGCGLFHKVPREPGLLCQLDIERVDGKRQSILSDASWEICDGTGWIRNTPKICIQQGPAEVYDAERAGVVEFADVAELYPAGKGPWTGLAPRSTALLARTPVNFRRFVHANRIEDPADDLLLVVPVTRLCHPGLVEANIWVGHASAMATLLIMKKAGRIQLDGGLSVRVNGRGGDHGWYDVKAGENLLLAYTGGNFGHLKELILIVKNGNNYTFKNPIQPGHENPWCFIPLPESEHVEDDMDRNWFKRQAQEKVLYESIQQRCGDIADVATLRERLGDRVQLLPSETMFLVDPYEFFWKQRVLGSAADSVTNPAGLIYENGEYTTVRPAKDGLVQLVYDLGEQRVGYWEFDLVADAGVSMDVFAVEYIAPSGAIQFPEGTRNGMRYITTEGRNNYVSVQRRSGRYLFITFHDLKTPLRIRRFGVIESTYPVEYKAEFTCSDSRLDRIWDISERTLKMCMEDSFTDCPLYEQTLWVGDARNESAFAYTTFGATDIALRCAQVAGQSLERYPIVGCQVPSGWDTILPAWSFLWGVSVWDYYFFTGDVQALRKMWKDVIANLKGAEKLQDKRGLFSAPYWNMFDWTGIDDAQDTVLHNSMFVIGAIDAALKCAAALKDKKHVPWLKSYRQRLVRAINKLWNSKTKTYPDAVLADGTLSGKTSVHTSFLSTLYDIVEPANAKHAVKNFVTPPAGMTTIGSPFAIMYLYEAFDKLGLVDEIMKSIYKSYTPMLESGASTVWETFPNSWPPPVSGFPTRSHCHAWSSAPLMFLQRVVLGVRQTVAAGQAYEISPYVKDLGYARGTVVSARGMVRVEWRRDGVTLDVTVDVPEGTQFTFVRNASHKGLKVRVNGKRV